MRLLAIFLLFIAVLAPAALDAQVIIIDKDSPQWREWQKRGRKDILDPFSSYEAAQRNVEVEELSHCWWQRKNMKNENLPCPAIDRLCTMGDFCQSLKGAIK